MILEFYNKILLCFIQAILEIRIVMMYNKKKVEKTKGSEFMEEKIKKHPTKKAIIIISVVAIIVIFIVCMLIVHNNQNENIIVANNSNDIEEQKEEQSYVSIDGGLNGLVGKTQEEVTEILEKAGLTVKISEEKEFSDTIPSGCVIKCSGNRATGKWHYKIDELDSTQIAIIKNSMKNEPDMYNLYMYEKIYEYTKLTDTNLIQGDTLYLTISKGKEVIMPNLKGLTQNEAKQVLLENNLQYKETTSSDVEKKENTVIEQSIEPNESIEENTEITVTVNKLQKISIDVSSMGVGNEPVTVRLEFDDPSQRYVPLVANVNVSPKEKDFQCLMNIGKQTNITVYINGNDIYSTRINPNGSQSIIYIKNPNPVEERVLDIY